MSKLAYEEKKEALMSNLQKQLPQIRKQYGISQAELGEMVGLSRQTISGIERGSISMNWTVYLAIVLFLGANSNSVFYFADGSGLEDIELDTVQKVLHINNNKK